MTLHQAPIPRQEPIGRPSRLAARDARPERRCAFGRCDGSGWHLSDEDVASPCRCQRLPRDKEAQRQSKRILRRHLALSLAAPPLAEIDPACLEALRELNADITATVRSGSGLWLDGNDDTGSAACAFLAGEAMRRAIPVLLYPGDELLGRLRRLASDNRGSARLEREIYDRLANIDLLLIDGIDAAARPARYPEPQAATVEGEQEARGTPGEEPIDRSEPTSYEPGMTDLDLSRLFQIIDQRFMNRKATVIRTHHGKAVLEDDLLHLPGVGPSGSTEPRRRARQLRRLMLRVAELCGPPLHADR